MMKRFLARRERANGRAVSGGEREGKLYKDNPRYVPRAQPPRIIETRNLVLTITHLPARRRGKRLYRFSRKPQERSSIFLINLTLFVASTNVTLLRMRLDRDVFSVHRSHQWSTISISFLLVERYRVVSKTLRISPRFSRADAKATDGTRRSQIGCARWDLSENELRRERYDGRYVAIGIYGRAMKRPRRGITRAEPGTCRFDQRCRPRSDLLSPES